MRVRSTDTEPPTTGRLLTTYWPASSTTSAEQIRRHSSAPQGPELPSFRPSTDAPFTTKLANIQTSASSSRLYESSRPALRDRGSGSGSGRDHFSGKDTYRGNNNNSTTTKNAPPPFNATCQAGGTNQGNSASFYGSGQCHAATDFAPGKTPAKNFFSVKYFFPPRTILSSSTACGPY